MFYGTVMVLFDLLKPTGYCVEIYASKQLLCSMEDLMFKTA